METTSNGLNNSNDVEAPQESAIPETENQMEMEPLVRKNTVTIDPASTLDKVDAPDKTEKTKLFKKKVAKTRSLYDLFQDLQSSDGTVDIADLEKDVANEYDEWKYGMPKRNFEYLLRQFKTKYDTNKDGKISSEEWHTWVSDLRKKKQGGTIRNVIAYSEQWTCSPPTVFIGTITLLQILFFLLTKYAPEGIGSYSYSFKEGNPGNHTGQDYDKVIRCSCLIYNPYRRVDVWRFFTYMFLHGGWMHLGWNVVIQLLVGIPLEMAQPGWKGTLRVAGLFMAGIIVGGLGAGVAEHDKYLVGSSPGTYALIMAHLACLALNWKEDGQLNEKQKQSKQAAKEEGKTVRARAYLKKNVRIGRLLFVVGFMLIDIILTIKNVILCDRDEINNPYCKSVSRAGHGFGALIGLTVGVFILHNRKVEPWEQKLKIAAFILSGILVGSLIVWHLLGGDEWFTVMKSIGNLHCTNPTPLCAYE